jgi:hypothetical protein
MKRPLILAAIVLCAGTSLAPPPASAAAPQRAAQVRMHLAPRASLLLRHLSRAPHMHRARPDSKNYMGSVGPYTPLNILWRVLVGGADRMITVDPGERDAYPLEGEIFYAPLGVGSIVSQKTLYRLYNGADHSVSTNPNEGRLEGYHAEGPLAYPFASAQTATTRLIRTHNASIGDYSLRNATGLEFEQGYVDQPLSVFGYPRYYNNFTYFKSLRGGGVAIQSNVAAGGALWHWTWNGMQVVNNYDYGRQIQTDIFPSDYANPTEAGDGWSPNFRPPGQYHGSPIALAVNNGLTQSTRSVPLEFDPDGTLQCQYQPPPGPCPGFGGGQDNPVIWPEVMLGKDVTLNFRSLGPVALYTTSMQVPKPLDANAAREIPVVYLRAGFTRMFTYDAASAALTEQPCSPNGVTFTPNYGGVIATTPNQQYAVGEYAVSTSQGGSAAYLAAGGTWACPGPPSDTGEFDFDTTILDAVAVGPFNAGLTTTNVYIVGGNLQQVVGEMASLYALRGSIPR